MGENNKIDANKNIEENIDAEKVEETKKFEPIVFVNNPISNANEDVIGFESQVETLICAIENDANMIGIIADYGTGKSSMTKLLTEKIKETNNNNPIKINMWDCLSKLATDSKESENVSALTKSFLYQLASGHSTKFGRYINKILSKNYGSISFSTNDDKRFIWSYLAAGILFTIYKVLGISGTGILQYIPWFGFVASFLKICAPVFLLGTIIFAFCGLKDTFIAFSHWKMPNRREPEISDVYDTYSLITEKIIPKEGKQLVFIDDLDRINKKKLIIEFLKELYRFQDSLGKEKEKLVFVISIKPESQLKSEAKKDEEDEINVYSKIFDITISLKPIHFDDYDSILLKLIDCNSDQKYKLESLLDVTFNKGVPKDFKWIKKGTNLTLRNMKDRLNQAISIMIALKNKDYKVKTSAKFNSCAAVAYLEDQYQKDYYELIKHETAFSNFMQATRLIMDAEKSTERLQKIKEEFNKHFTEKIFSTSFIDDFCEMVQFADFNDDYRMYFYTYPKGSHIKTTDERTLCDYILLPNSHSQHNDLDEVVARVFESGKNEIIKNTIRSLDVYPSVLIENDTLFKLSANIDCEKTFSIFSQEVISSQKSGDEATSFWKRFCLLSEDLYKEFVNKTTSEAVAVCNDKEDLLTLRTAIARGMPDRMFDFADLYNSEVFDFAPQITKEEAEIIGDIDISLKLVDVKNISEEHFDFLSEFVNSESLKPRNAGSFGVACSIWKEFFAIIKPERMGKKLLNFLQNNKDLNDEFFKVVCQSGVEKEEISEYLREFNPEEFSEEYLEMIDDLGFGEGISQQLIRVLLENNHYYTPLLFGVKQNELSLLDGFALDAQLIIEDCERINETSPETIYSIRELLYHSKGIKELNKLYFKPFLMISGLEFSEFDNVNEAIELIDTTQFYDDNYSALFSVIYKKNFSSEDLIGLMEWLFNEEKNEDCVLDPVLRKQMYDALDFKALNMKSLSELQREKVHALMSDVCVNNTSEDALKLLQKYGCLIPSLEESVGEDSELDVEYSKLIASYDEFSSFTSKWLNKHYIRYGLSDKLCEILFEEKDYENYIIADCLRKNNMILDERILFKNYIDVYNNVEEMFDLMSGHWDFLEKVQATADFSKFDKELLIPIFEVPQTERFFQYIFSDENETSIKEEYLQKFGKFKTEQDSKAFQRLICKDENMELLGSYDLYYRIHRQLWESNPTHKGLFTKAWRARWKKELDEKTLVTLD